MQLREEPGKQKTRSCRAQELARSSAQENARVENGDVIDSGKIGIGGTRAGHAQVRVRSGCVFGSSQGQENPRLCSAGSILSLSKGPMRREAR